MPCAPPPTSPGALLRQRKPGQMGTRLVIHVTWLGHRADITTETRVPSVSPTSTVLKSHQAGKVTSSPWHGGDTEKSHQVVESHIREEESPWHSLFHPYLEMYIVKSSRSIAHSDDFEGHKLIQTNSRQLILLDLNILYWCPASRDQIKPLLVQPQISCNASGLAVANPIGRAMI